MNTLLHHVLAWFLNSPRSVFGGALVAPGGLLVEGVRVALPRAALRVCAFCRVCFACFALCFALCMRFAFPRCATGGNGFNDACNDVEHGAIPGCWMIEIDFIIRGLWPLMQVLFTSAASYIRQTLLDLLRYRLQGFSCHADRILSQCLRL